MRSNVPDARSRCMELAYGSLESRVVCALNRLTKKFGIKHANGTLINRSVKTHELATIVAASRPRVSLVVQELIRRGRLARVKGKFLLP